MDLFPNPAEDVLYVDLDVMSEGSYFIRDLYGRILLKGRVLKNPVSIDTRNLLPGIYYLHFDFSQMRVNRLFVIR